MPPTIYYGTAPGSLRRRAVAHPRVEWHCSPHIACGPARTFRVRNRLPGDFRRITKQAEDRSRAHVPAGSKRRLPEALLHHRFDSSRDQRLSRPLVTIVTPSFNQGRFIRQTIESVLSQDYPHIEYVIMDGGSTDETASVAAEYSDRLTFFSEADHGQSHAINKGFRMARGEVVSWLNSDDVILPGAVAHAVKAFE